MATLADLVETFNAGLDPVPDTAYHRAAAEFFTPNIWPATPAGLPVGLGRVPRGDAGPRRRIMGLMAEALGLGGGYFAPLHRPADGVDHRQPLPGARPRAGRRTSSAAARTPTTARSRCWRPTACPGLQLQDTDGSWAPTDPVPGAFHVNTGDMLAHWSGGHWRSTWHRVVPPPGGPPYPERTSIAYFHSPNADTVIAPLPGRSPVEFEPVVAGRYLRAKIDRYYAPRRGSDEDAHGAVHGGRPGRVIAPPGTGARGSSSWSTVRRRVPVTVGPGVVETGMRP